MPIAPDPLSLVFFGCFLFALLYIVVAAMAGHLFHSHAGTTHVGADHIHTQAGHATAHTDGDHHQSRQEHGPSLLSYITPTSAALFLLGFGFFGYLFHTIVSLMLPIALLLAVVSGLIVAFLLISLINRIFGDSEGATVQDVADRVGLLGSVSMTIKELELGEILYVSPGGMRKSIPARSIDGRRFERGQEVVVVNYQHGVAEVDTWDHFVNQEADGASPSSTSISAEQQKLRALFEEIDQKDTEIVTPNDRQKE